MSVLIAALSYGEQWFEDRDLSILCCTSNEVDALLSHSLERRKNANVCNAAGNRYRRLNAIAAAWDNWRAGAGKMTTSICYDAASRSLCNAFCSRLRIGDVLLRSDVAESHGVVTGTYLKSKDCDWFSYWSNHDGVGIASSSPLISIASSSPSTIAIPPRSDII